MKRLEIIRTEKLPQCIRGVVKIDGETACVSLELPYLDNKTNVSAIPVGVYDCVPYKSATRGNVFRILKVPNRTDILIHAGNTAKDTQGCILVGQEYGELDGEPAVLESKAALADLRKHLAGAELFRITVREEYK